MKNLKGKIMNRVLSIEEVQNLLLSVMIEFDCFCRKHELKYYMIGGSLLGAVRHAGFIPWDDDMDVGMMREEYEKFLLIKDEFTKEYDIINYRCCESHNCDYVITRIYINNTMIDNAYLTKAKLDKRLYFDIFPLDCAPDDNNLASIHKEKILKMKKTVGYLDPKNYNNTRLEMTMKAILSFVLNPFRCRILARLEHEMIKYRNTNHICSLASQYSYEKQYFTYDVYGEPKEYSFCNHMFMGPAKPEKYLSQLYGEDYMELPPVEKRRKGWDVYEIEQSH